MCNLCELFAQIDINGDGTMEWDEFTSFIVEMGMASHDHQPDAIQKYNYAGCKEVGKRRTSYIAQVRRGGGAWCVVCGMEQYRSSSYGTMRDDSQGQSSKGER